MQVAWPEPDDQHRGCLLRLPLSRLRCSVFHRGLACATPGRRGLLPCKTQGQRGGVSNHSFEARTGCTVEHVGGVVASAKLNFRGTRTIVIQRASHQRSRPLDCCGIIGYQSEGNAERAP